VGEDGVEGVEGVPPDGEPPAGALPPPPAAGPSNRMTAGARRAYRYDRNVSNMGDNLLVSR